MWLRRISIFLLTNILVVVSVSIIFYILENFLGLRLDNYTGSIIIWAGVWGMGGAFISLLLSKQMAKWMMKIQIIDPNTSDRQGQELLEIVNRLSHNAGLTKVPEVGIYEAPEINAFATGPSRNNSLVAVSTGLLEAMDHDEVEGVLGHELTHVANGDMVTMTLIQGVVNAFVMILSRLLASVIANNVAERNRGMVRFMLYIVFEIAFMILGSMVVNYFSRQREFRADAGGARIAGRNKMIAGLKRLRSQVEQIQQDRSGLATLKITDRPSGWASLFSTHPSLDERIARLEQQV